MNGLSPEARALLDIAGEAHRPPSGAKAALRARIEAAAGAPSAAVLEAEGGMAVGRASVFPWAAGAAGAAGAGLALVLGLVVPSSEPRTLPEPIEARAPSFDERRVLAEPVAEAEPVATRRTAPARPAPEPAERARPVAKDAAASDRDSIRESARAEAPAPEVTEPERPGARLAEEARLLAGARAALRDGDAAAALTHTQTHAERFPDGALLEERLAARALALCALGRSVEARELVRALEARSPTSPHLARLSEACGE